MRTACRGPARTGARRSIIGQWRRWWPPALVGLWTATLTAVLVWPLTRSGYPLGHDLVFTPRQPLNAGAVGLSSTPARAVPVDALVAVAERVVDGAVVGRVAIVLPLLAAGIGCARLLRGQPWIAQAAAAGAAVWNPFVVERLALGQWALLWAYGALPWMVVAARASGAARWAGLAAAVAAASITPTGGVISCAAAAVAVLALRVGRRAALAALALAGALQLPWLLPALVSTAAATSDPAGVAAFSARSEHAGGALLSLLGGGGIWDGEVVPSSRGGPLALLGLAVAVAAAAGGYRRLAEVLGRRVVLAWAGLAGAGLVLALLPTVPPGAALLRWLVRDVPGAGLLRDSQKWILPLPLLTAGLLGAAVARLNELGRGRGWRFALAAAAVSLPPLVLPDGPATLRPTLSPVHYPADWARVVAAAGRGDAAVLPLGSYRRFAWAPGRSVLDPAPRLLAGDTVVDDRLAVSGRVLSGESRRAAAFRAALGDRAALVSRLRRLGLRWVVVEHGTPGAVGALPGLRPVVTGTDVSLYEVPGRVRPSRPATWRVAVVLAGDGLALALLLGLLIRGGWTPMRSMTRTRRKAPRPG